jgi:hypothetical protein
MYMYALPARPITANHSGLLYFLFGIIRHVIRADNHSGITHRIEVHHMSNLRIFLKCVSGATVYFRL